MAYSAACPSRFHLARTDTQDVNHCKLKADGPLVFVTRQRLRDDRVLSKPLESVHNRNETQA